MADLRPVDLVMGRYMAFLFTGGFYGFWHSYSLLLGVLQPIKEKLKLLVVVLLSVGTVSLFCSKEVMTTLSMNKTASQRQSTQGRMNATCSALNVFPLHLWFGAGTGNYTLAMDKELNRGYNTGLYNFCS